MAADWRSILATLLLLSNSCNDCFGPLGTEAGKVLGVFHFPGHSHFVMFEALMKELARQGHQVTVVSHFPQKDPIANYTDISLKGSQSMMAGGFTVQGMLQFDLFKLTEFLWKDNVDICEKALEHPNMQKLIQSKDQYDVILLEIFGFDCCYGVAWKFQAPVIGMISLARMPWGQLRMGNPENPSYFPSVYSSYTPRMTFWERAHNTLSTLYSIIGERLTAYPVADALNQKFFGPEIPALEDLLYNTSLVLLNTHFSINGAFPAVPGVVEVGGLHVSTSKEPLAKDLEQWLDGAGETGAVYVSFGSLARAEEMPLRQLDAMEKALGALAQRVVWKCDGAIVAQRLGRPLHKNIFTAAWMPQAAVLAHPKVRVFVSHGGLMGTQESVYWGKPMIVVPLFSDQYQNGNNLVEKGMARTLLFNDITDESFSEALRALLDNPSYTQNARHLSTLFRDRPRTALQEAVAWTEYVMRHRGAPHLRSGAVHLQWWQLCLLDVVAAAVASLAIVFFLLRSLTLFICRLLCRSSKMKVKRN